MAGKSVNLPDNILTPVLNGRELCRGEVLNIVGEGPFAVDSLMMNMVRTIVAHDGDTERYGILYISVFAKLFTWKTSEDAPTVGAEVVYVHASRSLDADDVIKLIEGWEKTTGNEMRYVFIEGIDSFTPRFGLGKLRDYSQGKFLTIVGSTLDPCANGLWAIHPTSACWLTDVAKSGAYDKDIYLRTKVDVQVVIAINNVMGNGAMLSKCRGVSPLDMKFHPLDPLKGFENVS